MHLEAREDTAAFNSPGRWRSGAIPRVAVGPPPCVTEQAGEGAQGWLLGSVFRALPSPGWARGQRVCQEHGHGSPGLWGQRGQAAVGTGQGSARG